MECSLWLRTCMSRLETLRADAKTAAMILRERKILVVGKRKKTRPIARHAASSSVSPPHHSGDADIIQPALGKKAPRQVEAEITAVLAKLGWLSDGPRCESEVPVRRRGEDIEVVVVADDKAEEEEEEENEGEEEEEEKEEGEGGGESKVPSTSSLSSAPLALEAVEASEAVELASTLFPLATKAERRRARKYAQQGGMVHGKLKYRIAGNFKSAGSRSARKGNDSSPSPDPSSGPNSSSSSAVAAATISDFRSEFESKWRTAVTCPKGHSLSLTHKRGNWTCDAHGFGDGSGTCLSSGTDLKGRMRWRCEKGCDFDFCGPCYEHRMRTELMPNTAPGIQTNPLQAKPTTLRKLERERRRLKRQIDRVKLRSKYDEILGSIVDRQPDSGFLFKRPSETLVPALRRLRDLLREHPPGDDETSSSSEPESEDDGSSVGAEVRMRRRRTRETNFRSMEVSRTYLLKEVLEMIRVEEHECWRKNVRSSSTHTDGELQEAVGEVLRAFYGFSDIGSSSAANNSR